jgi:hypothetical protein
MAITLFPFTTDFAAEIGDVDLRHPLAADDLQGACATLLPSTRC